MGVGRRRGTLRACVGLVGCGLALGCPSEAPDVESFDVDGAYLMPCAPLGFAFGDDFTFGGRALAELAALAPGDQPPGPTVRIEGPGSPAASTRWRPGRDRVALEIAADPPLAPEATYTVRLSLAGFAQGGLPLAGERSYAIHTLAADAAGTLVFAEWRSKSLGEVRRFELYLPPGHGLSPDQRYPTLHGYLGGQSELFHWRSRMQIDQKLDRMIASCEVVPMMFAVPDPHVSGPYEAFGEIWFDSGDFSDWWGGGRRFETYLAREFPSFLEERYRARGDKWGRATIGYSTGAWGAATVAFRNRDRFGATVPMSAMMSLRYMGGNPYKTPQEWPYWTNPTQRFLSENIFTALAVHGFLDALGPDLDNWKAHNPADIAEEMTDADFAGNIFMAAGDADHFELVPHMQDLQRILDARGVRHWALRSPDGPHREAFWRPLLDFVLPFVSRAFRGEPQPPIEEAIPVPP